MILSDISIRRPVFAAVVMLILVTLGAASYRWLSVEMYPNVEIPYLSIVTKFPGSSPESVEREVSKRIEETVNTISGVKHIYSFSSEGLSTVLVEFRLEEKINEVAQETRAKISEIRGQFPKGIEEPIIQKYDLNAQPVVSLALQSSNLSTRELTVWAEKKVKRRMESIPGVGKVDIVGSAKREVNVIIDPTRLQALGLGVDTIVNGLRSENVNTPLGRLNDKGTEYTIRVSGKPSRAEDFRDMVVAERSGRPIRLSEVAEVRDGVREQRSLGLVNGKPAVAFDIRKQSGANVVNLVDEIKKRITVLQAELPPGVSLILVRDASIPIRESLHDVQLSLIIGAILTILIVFCFINSWRSTVITGLTLPISIISSFIIMKFMGMSLNMMTMMALSLAIGLLIDDAIVVRENIVRHLENGEDHFSAARNGTSEIGLAVFATTMSIVAVFVPVAFMKGIVGRFFFQFGITVAFAVLVSLLVSFTLDPMLSSRWHDPAIEMKGRRRGLAAYLDRFNEGFERMADRYQTLIVWVLDRRKSVMITAGAAFVAGLAVFALLESNFMPTFDTSEFQVFFKTAPDASITETENRLKAMLDIVKEFPEVSSTYASIGAGDNGTVRSGILYVKLKDKSSRNRSQSEIQNLFRERLLKIPGILITVTEADRLAGEEKSLKVTIRGTDIGLLKNYAKQLRDEMYGIKGIVDMEISMEHDIPEYRLSVDREKAMNAGVLTDDIVRTVGALVGGEVVSTYDDEDGDAVEIRVRLPEHLRKDPDQVRDLQLTVMGRGPNLVLLPLENIVTYDTHETPSEINRQDMSRQITIGGNVQGLALGTAVERIKEVSKKIKFEPGYTVGFVGESEDMRETFAYMAEALILAVLFVYFILAAQFESFLEPLAIMFSLPLSIIGMAGMLFLTGDTLNIMSLIGLIMLMGLVTKNAILLVDYAKNLRSQGMDRRDALSLAGRTRLRPIMMTTLAMIFGMLPLAFKIGTGAEMRAPMARAVIGGLLTSTVLTLVVVPVMYTLLDDSALWVKKHFDKKDSNL